VFVCCECCVLSGRGLCDKLITHPEESYQLWCVVVCDLETSRMRRPWPALGCSVTEKKTMVLIKIQPPCVHAFTYKTLCVWQRVLIVIWLSHVHPEEDVSATSDNTFYSKQDKWKCGNWKYRNDYCLDQDSDAKWQE